MVGCTNNEAKLSFVSSCAKGPSQSGFGALDVGGKEENCGILNQGTSIFVVSWPFFHRQVLIASFNCLREAVSEMVIYMFVSFALVCDVTCN